MAIQQTNPGCAAVIISAPFVLIIGGSAASEPSGVICGVVSLLVIVGVIIHAVTGAGAEAKGQLSKTEKSEQLLEKIEASFVDFSISQKCRSAGFICNIYFDDERSLFAIIHRLDDPESENNPEFGKIKFYRPKDLIEVKILEDDTTILQQDNSSIVTRAAVGGLLFGSAGAIIGGVTGKSTAKSIVSKLGLRILVNDKQHPSYYMPFLRFSTPQPKDSFDYAGNLELLEHWFGIFQALMHDVQNEREQNRQRPKTIIPTTQFLDIDGNTDERVPESRATKLKELADMYREDLLTKSEFDALKQELFDLKGN